MVSEIPEWIQYVAGAVSIVIVSVAARLGWKAAPNTNGPVEVAGAIVDNRAAHDIVESINSATKRYVDCNEEALRAYREITVELRTLHQEVRELAREVAMNRR